MKLTKALGLATVWLLLPAAAGQTEEATLTLRQGADEYTGFADVSIDVASRFESDPAAPQLTAASGSFYREGAILIRADVSSIPLNATISKAELALHGGAAAPATLTAHQVLTSWNADEVNWVETGDGATWSAPGMQAATDYTPDALDTVIVGGDDAAWCRFDVTQAAQQWVRDPEKNFGLVLLGYWPAWKAGPTRTFASSESPKADQRPYLMITFDPQAPLADAGDDLRAAPGSQVKLDASGSRDASSGAVELSYSWRITAKPAASGLQDDLGRQKVASFRPDVPGDYVIELTVTDSDGNASSDTVTVRPRVRSARPRLWINADNLQSLKDKIVSEPKSWQLVLAKCADESTEPVAFFSRPHWRGPIKMSGLANCALNYLLTGNERQGREAVAIMMENCAKGLDLLRYADGKVGAVHVGATALGYDWCHDLLTADQRKTVVAQLNEWADWCITRGRDNDNPASNYFHRYLWVVTATALATYHENGEAERLLRHAKQYMLASVAGPWLAQYGAGGNWPEGNGRYDGPLFLAYALAGIKTATGQDIFKDTPFFEDSIYYHLHATLPAVSGPVEVPPGRYDPKLLASFYDKGPCLIYPSGEYDPDGYGIAIPGLYQYAQHTQYMTITSWALRRKDPEAGYARWWLDNTPGTAGHCAWTRPARSQPLTAVIDFIFADRSVVGEPPGKLPRLYPCSGTGFVTWRSSWERDATFFAFDCGPRVSSNQRRSANGIFIYKRGYLIGHVPNVRLETNDSVSMTIDGYGQTTMLRDCEPRLLACTNGTEHAYVAGDATGAYNSSFFGRRMCESFTRQVVVVAPGLFVIFDRATPSDPSSGCEFLCFFGDRPVSDKGSLYAKTLGGEPSAEPSDIFVSKTMWDAKAYLQLLLPAEPSLETFPRLGHAPQIRLAFTPADKPEEQNFLALIYVPEPGEATHPQVQLTDGLDSCGIEGTWGDKHLRIDFNRRGPVGGHIVVTRRGAKLADADLK